MSENESWIKVRMAVTANKALMALMESVNGQIPAAERPANLTQYLTYLSKQYGSAPATPEDIAKEVDFYKETISGLKQNNLDLNNYINEMQAVIQQRKDDIIRLTNELEQIKKQSIKTETPVLENKPKNGFFWWG